MLTLLRPLVTKIPLRKLEAQNKVLAMKMEKILLMRKMLQWICLI